MTQRVLTTLLVKGALLSGVLPAALASCVAEKIEECPPLYLMVKTDYEVGQGRRVITSAGTPVENWYNGIENVSVYVFDENNRYVTLWEGGAYTLGDEYMVPVGKLRLADGNYNFVVWTNRGDMYSHDEDGLSGRLHVDDLEMHMRLPADRVLFEDIDHRHHGTLENVSFSRSGGMSPNLAVITSTTHRINFTVRGVEGIGLSPEDVYEVKVTDRNASHSFGNRHIEGENEYYHVRELVASEGTRADGMSEQKASMVLMQVHDDTGTVFELVNKTTGEALPIPLTNDLVGFITEVYRSNGQTPDFDTTVEFNIAISYLSSTRLVIQINGWTYILNEQEL